MDVIIFSEHEMGNLSVSFTLNVPFIPNNKESFLKSDAVDPV